MPWAGTMPSVDESEAHCRASRRASSCARTSSCCIFVRGADGGEGELVGATGLHRIDWTLRKFEIGYWRRRPAARARLRHRGGARAGAPGLRRARCAPRRDPHGRQQRARAGSVAERAGFTLEALLRFDSATPAGEPRSTRIYARVRGAEEPIGGDDAGVIAAPGAGAQSATPLPGEKRSTASVMMPSMPSASSRRASAGSLTV